MLERLARFCVGIGLLWVLGVVFFGLTAGPDRPEQWLGFVYLDRVMDPDARRAIYGALGLVVVPVGMLTVLRDLYRDPGPLWLRAAAPGAFVAIYALFLAAALPELGQPLLQTADPVVTRFISGITLTGDRSDKTSWLLRFVAMFGVLAGVPWALGLVAGLLAGGTRRR